MPKEYRQHEYGQHDDADVMETEKDVERTSDETDQCSVLYFLLAGRCAEPHGPFADSPIVLPVKQDGAGAHHEAVDGCEENIGEADFAVDKVAKDVLRNSTLDNEKRNHTQKKAGYEVGESNLEEGRSGSIIHNSMNCLHRKTPVAMKRGITSGS